MSIKTKIGLGVLVVAIVGAAVYFASNRSGHIPQATNPKQREITVIGEGYPPLQALGALKSEFETQYGISVRIVEKAHTDVIAEVTQEAMAKRSSYDLILLPHRLLGRFAEGGQVRRIDDLLKSSDLAELRVPAEDLFPRWFEEISWYKGAQYGYPFSALTMLVAYRKDLFEDPSERSAFFAKFGRELAPPRTWDEYLQVVQFFNRPEKGLYGTVIGAQDHPSLWYEWLSFVAGFHGRVLDSDRGDTAGNVVVDSPAVEEATTYFKSLLAFTTPDARNFNWDDTLAFMQQGRAAIYLAWTDAIPALEDATQSKVHGKMGYATMPTPDGKSAAQLEGWTYLIPTAAKNPEDAVRFMLWAMQPKQQVAQTLAGGASPRISTYQDFRVKALPHVAAFLEAVPVAQPKPTIPQASNMSEFATRELALIMSGMKSVKEGLAEIAAHDRQLLSQPAHEGGR